jgi:hypothetical protein
MKRTKILESIAHHEAGHVVVAAHLHLAVHGLSLLEAYRTRARGPLPPYFELIATELPIAPPGPVEASALHPVSQGSSQRLENMAIVCLAGPEAQRRFYPSAFTAAFAAADRAQAEAILGFLVCDPGERAAYLNLIEVRTRRLVAAAEIWQPIGEVAASLLNNVTMDAREVRAAIRRTQRAAAADLVEAGSRSSRHVARAKA